MLCYGGYGLGFSGFFVVSELYIFDKRRFLGVRIEILVGLGFGYLY